MHHSRWLATASLGIAILGCGGAKPDGDVGVVIPGHDAAGDWDAGDPGGAPRDGLVADVADGSDAPAELPGGDVVATQDHGAGTDLHVEDPGTPDPGPVDPGTPYDPGAPEDPGPAFDPGPDTGWVGGCDPCGMGTIAGKTCAPNVKTAIPYVRVWVDAMDCDGNLQHYQTYSTATGEYSLQIPCGTQTINMLKGSFHGQFTRWIDKGRVTTVTSADGCFPGTAAKIVVVTGDWDKIEDTLALLRLNRTQIDGRGGDSGQTSQTAINFLSDSSKLNEYDILFLDCTWAGWPDMQSSSASAIKAALKAFVAKGGSIYASDYALPYLSETWPGYILGGGWSAAGNSSYVTNVVDTDLAGFLGKTQVTIRYGLGPLTCVSGVGPNTHVFIDSTKAIGGCDGTEMMVSFEPETNGGRVIYTTFHNDEQPTAGGDMQSILEYTVFLM